MSRSKREKHKEDGTFQRRKTTPVFLNEGGVRPLSEAEAVFLLLQWWFWTNYEGTEVTKRGMDALKETISQKLKQAFWERKRAYIRRSYSAGQFPEEVPRGRSRSDGSADGDQGTESDPAYWEALLAEVESQEASTTNPPAKSPDSEETR